MDIGGGELFARDLVRELASRGLDQRVFTVGAAGRLACECAAAGAPVTAWHKRSKIGLVAIRAMAAALRDQRPDLVHTHGEAGVFWGLPAAALARVPAVSLIYQNYRESFSKMWAARAWLRYPRRVVAGSASVARFLERDLAVPPAKLAVIHCGIDLSDPAQPSRAGHRAAPVIVSVGRLVERKGHRVLIDAFQTVRARYPDARLHLAGDGPLRSTLEAQATAAGLAGAVRFPGTVYPPSAAFADADLFVFPSLVEPQGLAVLNAFAAGVPVVASRTGGIVEMVEDGVDGLLATPGDAGDLSRAMLRVLDDPALGSRLTAAARRRLPSFDVRTLADEYVKIYAGVTHAR